MAVRTDLTVFGSELRRWREHRRFSQLELATLAEVSQRHLSFLENGRSRPSTEMIEHLAESLDVPLRARNSLLNAAGFADGYSQESLDGPALAQVRASLETLVDAHHPFPAYIVDRCWNLHIANGSAAVLTGLLLPTEQALALGSNVLRLFLHPDGARHNVTNWPNAAAVLLDRLATECSADPTDLELRALYEEVRSYPGVGTLSRQLGYPSTGTLLTEIHVATPDTELRLFTTISSLASAADVTLEELRLETLLPADAETAERLRTLASGPE